MKEQISLRTGPFLVSLETDDRPFVQTLRALYPGTEVSSGLGIHNFHVRVKRAAGVRRWWHPQVRFFVDEGSPFEPFPLDHAFPMFEWGLNWCIAMRGHQFLMLHSAVVERGGGTLVLPALPGSGKSTLCAGLTLSGWRLLSDEFGLYDLEHPRLMPLPRPVPLKNDSVPIIRAFSEEAFLGPLFPKTRKGNIAHLRPPGDSLARQTEPGEPRWIVFPQFRKDHPLGLRRIPKSQAFVRLAQNSFNYAFLGGVGFDALTQIVSRCDCFSLVFGSLDDAVSALDDLCVV